MFNPTVPYNELPPVTILSPQITPDIAKLAEDTRVAIAVLDYAVNALPSPSILLDTLALQEARVSSNIENIITTNDDLYRGVVFEDYTAEAKEVSCYKDALFAGYSSLREKGILSLSDLERINEPVNKRQQGIRTNLPNFSDITHISNVKANGETEILYTPPHGKELLQELLIDMLDFVYNDDDFDIHPLIKIALAHYQFECIHPFRDGNGRTGRILNILFLCQKGYLSYPVLYASSYIIQNKNRYYALLQEAKQSETYQDVIIYMLTSFKETAKRTLNIVEQIRKLIEAYTSDEFVSRMKGQKELLLKVVDLLFKKAYVRIGDLVELGVHRQTASVYLEQFVDAGVLSKEKIGRDNLYKNIKLFELFDNDSEGIQ